MLPCKRDGSAPFRGLRIDGWQKNATVQSGKRKTSPTTHRRMERWKGGVKHGCKDARRGRTRRR
eukprot:387638-Rhodomonas_salina.1